MIHPKILQYLPTCTTRSAILIALLCISLLAPGCGLIADKSRIVVARMDGKAITRGDLMKVIREMTDEERPLIQNRGDLLRALNRLINDRIKADLAAQLKSEGKIQVSRDAARLEYFKKYPDFQSVYLIQDPEAMGMTQGEVNAVKADIEFGVDDEEEILLREEALLYKVQEAIQSGTVDISPEEFQKEFDLLKNQLIKFEWVDFIAIQFPAEAPGAIQEAAKARTRINEGESFDSVLNYYRQLNPALAIHPALENNPHNEKYKTFWLSVSGCKVGDIIGPLLLPGSDQIAQGPDGKNFLRKMPAAHLVLNVMEHEPERYMTVEEAAPELASVMLKRKVMDILRTERNVEVYPDELPRPEGYGDQFKGQFIDTSA